MKFRKPSLATTILLTVMTVFVATTIYAQQHAKAQDENETTARIVSAIVLRYHINQGDIDDAISKKMFHGFIKQLDPRKLYFTQADINKFKNLETQLDDQIKKGDLSFSKDIFELYQTRVNQRVALAKKLIGHKFDYTKNDSLVIDAATRSWAASEKEIEARWHQRIKADILSLKISGKTDVVIANQLKKRYENVIRSVREIDDIDRLEIYLSTMTHAFDPHSTYLSPQTLEDFQILMRLKLEGIGATLRPVDGYTEVVDVTEGGAAEKDGRLEAGDRIIGVDEKATGQKKDMVDVVEMKLTKVVRHIRGKSGSDVILKVKKADKVDEKTGKILKKGPVVIYKLTRQLIEIKSSEVKGEIINCGKRFGLPGKKIGILNVPSFYRDFDAFSRGKKDFKSATGDSRKVLNGFRAKGVDLVVVDLRSNGGGSLLEAIELSGLFIDKGPVVQVKKPQAQPDTHFDHDAGTAYSGPLVVVCNRGSASASEIFAGVIKDYKRGIIVGDKTTHGKGTVQNVIDVSAAVMKFLAKVKRGALKLTIKQFYRVNGDSTQNRGVESDVVLPSIFDHIDTGESFLENALKFKRIAPVPFKPVDLVSAKVIKTLQDNSKKRVAADATFQKVQKQIQTYLVRKKRKTISLNEVQRRKEWAHDKAIDDSISKLQDDEKKPKADKSIFPKSYYNDEIGRVALDYLSLLKVAKVAGK